MMASSCLKFSLAGRKANNSYSGPLSGGIGGVACFLLCLLSLNTRTTDAVSGQPSTNVSKPPLGCEENTTEKVASRTLDSEERTTWDKGFGTLGMDTATTENGFRVLSIGEETTESGITVTSKNAVMTDSEMINNDGETASSSNIMTENRNTVATETASSSIDVSEKGNNGGETTPPTKNLTYVKTASSNNTVTENRNNDVIEKTSSRSNVTENINNDVIETVSSRNNVTYLTSTPVAAVAFGFHLIAPSYLRSGEIDCQVTSTTQTTTDVIRMTKAYVTSNVTSFAVSKCNGHVRVANDFIMDVFMQNVTREPAAECSLIVSFCRQKSFTKCTLTLVITNFDVAWNKTFHRFLDYTMYVDVTAQSCSAFNLDVHYRALSAALELSLPVTMTSSDKSTGYVTTPGFDDGKDYPGPSNMSALLEVAEDEVMLVSFPHIDIENHTDCRYDWLQLSVVNSSGTHQLAKLCGLRDEVAMVIDHTLLVRFQSDGSVQKSGFKMRFTVLPRRLKPRQIEPDLFDCSLEEGYRLFAQHFNCNLAVNCQGMEDETDCPYTSAACGPGAVDAGDKCYTYSRVQHGLSWYDAYSLCRDSNRTLVNPDSPAEWTRFLQLMGSGKKTATVYTGLRSSQSEVAQVPGIYRDTWQWSHLTTALYVHVAVQSNAIPVCTSYVSTYTTLQTVSCVLPAQARFVCDQSKQPPVTRPGGVALPPLGSNVTWSDKVHVLACPAGHVVHDFLLCDVQSQCQEPRDGSPCLTQGGVSLFRCERNTQWVHMTLVCDFRLDCPDGSDETFCVHPTCPHDRCRTGQCLDVAQRCDGVQHCDDASDENCPQMIKQIVGPVTPPAVLDFDGRGSYSLTPVALSNASLTFPFPCPDTHFRCDLYCLPLYVRCNGLDDCPDGEDEVSCDRSLCPGFYRCRGSTVCLHPNHVCDGVFQCPQRDDELLCDVSCPRACLCQGLAFVCGEKFRAADFPALRYLDAEGSGMGLEDVADNPYLVHLSLASCGLTELTAVSLHNLRSLDLSHNALTTLQLDLVVTLKNLLTLVLTGNPLVIIVPVTSPLLTNGRLQDLDLSRTALQTLNASLLSDLPLTSLNLSHSAVTRVTPEGLGALMSLETLDFRGARLLEYPNDMLRDLSALDRMFADDHKLCCKAALPEGFNTERCEAPADDIASCDDLLRSDAYRAFLWLFAFLALLGNAGSFMARFYLQSESFNSSFNVLVTNLSVADFLMGVYLTVIGVADQVYRGQYLWQGEKWKASAACQAAGFLSLLSTEVSAFFICLITLDRVLVLRFPFSKAHLTQKSALIACGVAWVLGLCLAAVPLLPVTSHWAFYSQTGICIPLPFAAPGDAGFPGRSYSFGVLIVLNLATFVLIAFGQLVIYMAVRAAKVASKAKRKASRDAAIARRLTTIVMSDFLCWFPIGLLGLLASTGTPIPGEVNVGVAIFVLPFNAALNPFLYTFNIVMEKRRKAQESRMLQRLESRHFTELSRVQLDQGGVRLPQQLLVTKETALNQIEGWLGVRVITLPDLASRFDMMPRLEEVTASSAPPPPAVSNGLNDVS